MHTTPQCCERTSDRSRHQKKKRPVVSIEPQSYLNTSWTCLFSPLEALQRNQASLDSKTNLSRALCLFSLGLWANPPACGSRREGDTHWSLWKPSFTQAAGKRRLLSPWEKMCPNPGSDLVPWPFIHLKINNLNKEDVSNARTVRENLTP